MPGADDATHGLNKKAKLQVYLRDLQQECGLTESALQHIALIAGRRCIPTGHNVPLENYAHVCGCRGWKFLDVQSLACLGNLLIVLQQFFMTHRWSDVKLFMACMLLVHYCM